MTVLDANLTLDAPLHLRVGAGEVHLLDGPQADAVVAALIGDGGRHRITLAGRKLGHVGTAGRVRRGLGIVSGAPLAADVSVTDHLAAILGPRRAADLLQTSPLLAHRGNDPAGVLSGGERRILAWLRAIALGPAAVVLDRAAEGLDAESLRWVTDVVARWRVTGVALVVRPGRQEERGWATERASPSG